MTDDHVAALADATCNDAPVTGYSAAAEVLPFLELNLPWPLAWKSMTRRLFLHLLSACVAPRVG